MLVPTDFRMKLGNGNCPWPPGRVPCVDQMIQDIQRFVRVKWNKNLLKVLQLKLYWSLSILLERYWVFFNAHREKSNGAFGPSGKARMTQIIVMTNPANRSDIE